MALRPYHRALHERVTVGSTNYDARLAKPLKLDGNVPPDNQNDTAPGSGPAAGRGRGRGGRGRGQA